MIIKKTEEKKLDFLKIGKEGKTKPFSAKNISCKVFREDSFRIIPIRTQHSKSFTNLQH
jgi:hypothetical protein